MGNYLIRCALGCGFLFSSSALAIQTRSTTAPQTGPAATIPSSLPSGEKLRVTISEVMGNVQVRTSETAPWQPAKVGMELDEGAEFRTGVRSRVRFLIPPDQQITLDRLGIVKVLRAIREGKRVQTDLGMKYGITQYDVEEAGVDHESTIRSPGATLAVRGTKSMSLYDQGAFPPRAIASQPVRFRNLRGQVVAFGKAGRVARMDGDQYSPAEHALLATTDDPLGMFAGRTEQESEVVTYLNKVDPSLNVNLYPLLRSIIDPNFGGSGIVALPFPGQLNFLLTWKSQPGGNVDLSVISPLGEKLSITSRTSPSGGQHLGDGKADANGVGQETVLWDQFFPAGKYQIQATLRSGGQITAQVFVTQDPLTKGIRLGNFKDVLTTQRPTATHTITAPGSSTGGTTGTGATGAANPGLAQRRKR